jgi:hypothetical protein
MADHFSGPRAIARPARDITDLYVFKSPEQSAHLVLVMDVCPSVRLLSSRTRSPTVFSFGPSALLRLSELPPSTFGSAQNDSKQSLTNNTWDHDSRRVNHA